MNLSILETTVQYPEPRHHYIIENVTPNGWEILAICNTESEAVELYDQLNSEVEA